MCDARGASDALEAHGDDDAKNRLIMIKMLASLPNDLRLDTSASGQPRRPRLCTALLGDDANFGYHHYNGVRVVSSATLHIQNTHSSSYHEKNEI